GGGSGVKKAVAKNHVAETIDELLCHHTLVDAGPFESRHVGDLDAVNQLHRQYPASGEIAVDLGDDDVIARCEIALDRASVLAFVLEIELHRDVLHHFACHHLEIEIAFKPRQHLEHEHQVAQIGAHDSLDPGVLNLDGTATPVRQAGRMNLRERAKA